MKVKKILNNSVILAVDEHGTEAVLWGPGLGFAMSVGMSVDSSRVERTFVPTGTTNAERLAALVRDIPVQAIEVTEAILRAAQARLGLSLTDHLLVPLADHISFALQRTREGTAEIDYPLRWEIQQLYPAEVDFSRTALDLIEKHTGVRLSAVEAIPLALHFVNAQFAAPDLNTALTMTQILAQVLDVISVELNIVVDENSTPVARFVTHLRYLFLRERQNQLHRSDDDTLYDAIRNALPRQHACALHIAALLSARFEQPLSNEEVQYLTLHVGRLTATSTPHPPPADQEPPR